MYDTAAAVTIDVAELTTATQVLTAALDTDTYASIEATRLELMRCRHTWVTAEPIRTEAAMDIDAAITVAGSAAPLTVEDRRTPNFDILLSRGRTFTATDAGLWPYPATTRPIPRSRPGSVGRARRHVPRDRDRARPDRPGCDHLTMDRTELT